MFNDIFPETAVYKVKNVEWDDWKPMVTDLIDTLITEFHARVDKSSVVRDNFPRRQEVYYELRHFDLSMNSWLTKVYTHCHR